MKENLFSQLPPMASMMLKSFQPMIQKVLDKYEVQILYQDKTVKGAPWEKLYLNKHFEGGEGDDAYKG